MEQPDIPDSEVAEVVAEEPQEQAEIVEDQPEPDGTEQIADPDDEEIDYEGEKFKVPKKLKDAFLRQQDYTQKTQTVAEERKAVEAERESIKQQAQANQQYLAEVAEAVALNKQVEQLQKINWQELIETDPVQAMKLDRQMREAAAMRDQLAQSITQRQQQQALQTQQEAAKRMQEAEATLSREIPNWSSPETKQKLWKAGEALGIPKETLATVQELWIVRALNKAAQYDQLIAKQTTKPKPEAQEKPVTRIAATKAVATKDPDKMSTEDWLKWRNSQIKRNR